MFRDRIKAKYNELSPSFRKLADFVLQQQLDAALMTATELAERMGVDAATVVRFAQTLGYSGFRELSKEIQRVVKTEAMASYTVSPDTSDDRGLFRSLLENERNNLAMAQTQLTEQINAVLPSLLGARRIWVVGQGICAHLAALCASALRGIDLPAVFSAPNPLESAESLKGISGGDLVLGFSLTGMDLSVADAIAFARQHGANTVVFTASPVSAAALAAETTVTCPGLTQMHVPSFTGLAAMIVVLVAAFAVRHPEKVQQMQEDLRESYAELLELQARNSAEVDVAELWRQF